MTSVVVVSPMFPNRPGERLGNYIYDSAAALARQGHTVSALATRRWLPRIADRLRAPWLRDRMALDAFPELAEVRVVRHASIPRNRLWRAAEWLHDQRVEPALEALARRRSADVIHCHTEGEAQAAVRVGRRLGVPVVVTLHGIPTMPRYYDLPARRAKFAAALDAADRVVLVGEPMREFFEAVLTRRDHVRVVHNGVAAPATPAKRVLEDDLIRFVSASNLQESKGVGVALDALAAARRQGFENWRYTIAGDGPERAALLGRIQALQLGDKVDMLGAVPHADIQPLLAAADVFLLPSYIEAFGVAYLEAMAAGLLAIGVEGQGARAFIVDGGTGALVRPRDAGDLATRLLDLPTRRSFWADVAAAGARVARDEFSWARHADALAAVFDDVQGARGK